MIVVQSLSSLKYDADSVVSVGTFDGMHKGHQVIFNRVTERARSLNGRSVIITFHPHPRSVVGREPIKLLMTLNERIDIMKDVGIDLVYVINFTHEFAQSSARDFYGEHIIKGTGAREVIVGHDHMFGRNRKAGIDELKVMSSEYRFGLDVVDPVYIGADRVSSSKIRHFLESGDVEQAEIYLGRPYSLEGIVVEGEKRGQILGFPTANIKLPLDEKIIPASGVYCVIVESGSGVNYGMLNIGFCPTFGISTERFIEVHIFGIDENLYGKILKIRFLCRLRDEMKFSSPAALVIQLRNDRERCQSIINEKCKTPRKTIKE